MKIKHLAFILMTVFCLATISCGSDEVKEKLNGSWVMDKTIEEDGTSFQGIYSFNSEDETGKMEAVCEADNQSFTIEMPFTWTLIDDKTVAVTPKKDEIAVNYSQALLDALKEEGSDPAELTAGIKQGFAGQFDKIGQMTIESLTDNELTIRATDNSLLHLKRQ